MSALGVSEQTRVVLKSELAGQSSGRLLGADGSCFCEPQRYFMLFIFLLVFPKTTFAQWNNLDFLPEYEVQTITKVGPNWNSLTSKIRTSGLNTVRAYDSHGVATNVFGIGNSGNGYVHYDFTGEASYGVAKSRTMISVPPAWVDKPGQFSYRLEVSTFSRFNENMVYSKGQAGSKGYFAFSFEPDWIINIEQIPEAAQDAQVYRYVSHENGAITKELGADVRTYEVYWAGVALHGESVYVDQNDQEIQGDFQSYNIQADSSGYLSDNFQRSALTILLPYVVGKPFSYEVMLGTYAIADIYTNISGPAPELGLNQLRLYGADIVAAADRSLYFSKAVLYDENFSEVSFDPAFLQTASGFNYATSLVPVPEPEIYALLLAGLGLIGWIARRKTVLIQTAHFSA